MNSGLMSYKHVGNTEIRDLGLTSHPKTQRNGGSNLQPLDWQSCCPLVTTLPQLLLVEEKKFATGGANIFLKSLL